MTTISVKAKEILKRLGGVENAIIYLEANKSFSNIQGVGKTTDFQLQEYLKELARIGLEPIARITLTENDPFNIEIVIRYETLKEQCSNRTRNILLFLEGTLNYEKSLSNKILFLNTHFFQPFDFLNIRNSGKKTATELYKLCSNLKEFLKQNSPEPIFNEVRKLALTNYPGCEIALTFEQTKIGWQTVQEYEILKFKCSVRTINVLTDIEKKADYHNSIECKLSFIEKYFITAFDYYSLGKAGSKTVGELKAIRKEILLSLGSCKDSSSYKVPDLDFSSLTKFLNKHTFQQNLNELKVSGKYSLQKVFFVLLNQTLLSFKAKRIVELYLLSDAELSYRQIAEKVECTIETVRTTIHKITQSLIPFIVDSIKPFSNELIIENAHYDRSNQFLEIEPIRNFSFNNIEYNPNLRLSHFLLSHYLNQDWVFLNNLAPLTNEESRVFECANKFRFISIQFAVDTAFSKLILFLEDEIYSFESASFDYNLKILINRFYQENSLPLSKDLLEILCIVISKIKLEEIRIDSRIIKKLKRNQNKENIKQIVEVFLRSANQAKKTREILTELKHNNVEIDSVKLLHQLNKWTQTFARVGNGAWGLTEWLTSKAIKGSIREIVQKLLTESERPLHISEIISYFNTFRPIVETSLIANIKVSENIHFQIFHCSFIGLKVKDYEDYWFKIPRFVGSDLMTVVNNKSLKFEERVIYLESKGYPRLHCEYIIKKKCKLHENDLLR